MPSLFSKLQSKLELFRLEQRYTRNRHRRSTFISNAVYVDGEYIYQTPNSTGSSKTTTTSITTPIQEEPPAVAELPRRTSFEEPSSPTFDVEPQTPAQRKRLNRFSSMPGFGNGVRHQNGRTQTWDPSSFDDREMR